MFGIVKVEVTVGEQGNFVSARAISGHLFMQSAAVKAAQASTFSAVTLSGQKVKYKGIVVYNFVP